MPSTLESLSGFWLFVNTLKLLDRPIAFHRCLVEVAGSVSGALVLGQAIYWQNHCPEDKKHKGGWWWKTLSEWQLEVGMTRREFETIRKHLRIVGVLNYRIKGTPATGHYRVNTEKIEQILDGKHDPISVDSVVEIYGARLRDFSRAAEMRAKAMGCQTEPVSYEEVLKENGLVCHICKKAITTGIGQQQQSLSFDHIIPLVAGGKHVKNNIKPSHFLCNGSKGHQSVQTSLLTVSKQVCLPEANKYAYSKQSTSTETTTEITTETTKTRDDESDSVNRTTSRGVVVKEAAKKRPSTIAEVKAFAETQPCSFGPDSDQRAMDFIRFNEKKNWRITVGWKQAYIGFNKHLEDSFLER